MYNDVYRPICNNDNNSSKMTCNDCIHWKACKDSAYDYYGEDAASAYDEDNCCKAFAEICENFSDKSEWVHLPCKVGDIENNCNRFWT